MLPSSGDGLHWLSCTAVFPNVNHLCKLIFRHSLKNTNLAPDAKQLLKVNREEAWPGANSSGHSGLSSQLPSGGSFTGPLWPSRFAKLIMSHQGLTPRGSNCLGIVCTD